MSVCVIISVGVIMSVCYHKNWHCHNQYTVSSSNEDFSYRKWCISDAILPDKEKINRSGRQTEEVSETWCMLMGRFGCFRKRGKTTIIFIILSVRPSICLSTRKISASNGRIYMKFRISVSSKLSGKISRCINPLMPNGHYSGRTAPLTSKRCILYIYSTNKCTEYFEHALYSQFFFSSRCSLLHNANLFGSCIILILYKECAKIKKIIPAPNW